MCHSLCILIRGQKKHQFMMKTKTMEYKHNKGEWGKKTSPELRLEAMEEEAEREKEKERERIPENKWRHRDEQASSSQAYTAEKKK